MGIYKVKPLTKKTVALLVLCLSLSQVHAEDAPETFSIEPGLASSGSALTFVNVFSKGGWNDLITVTATADNAIVLGARIDGGDAQGFVQDGWILRIGLQGEKIKEYEVTSNNAEPASIVINAIKDTESGLLCVISDMAAKQCYITLVNHDGGQMLSTELSYKGHFISISDSCVNDNGIFVSGLISLGDSQAPGQDPHAPWGAFIDQTGTVAWEYIGAAIEGSETLIAERCAEFDGGFYLLNRKLYPPQNTLVQLDEEGNVLSEGEISEESIRGVIIRDMVAINDGVVVLGYIFQSGGWVSCFDRYGAQTWVRSLTPWIGAEGGLVLEDSLLLCAQDPQHERWLLRLALDGTMVHSLRLFDEENVQCSSFELITDHAGGIWIAGNKVSSGITGNDIFIGKLRNDVSAAIPNL